MHDLVRQYAQQKSGEYADAPEEARDRLLAFYLHMTNAADDYLRALPGMETPPEFSGREAALDWLDAERASLVAAVHMAQATGRDGTAVQFGQPSRKW